MKPRLLAISGSLTGIVRELIDSPISVGRLEANQLCLSDPAVSRKHCTIEKLNGHYELVDLDSRSGTFVNGMPILRRTLEHGDNIHIGNTGFVFLMHEGEVSPPQKFVRLIQLPPPETLLFTSLIPHRKLAPKSGEWPATSLLCSESAA